MRRGMRGVAAVEFALVLPVFLLLLLGMMDYSWYFFIELATTNAAREGARAATTQAGACPNPSAAASAQNAVNARMTQVGQAGNATTTVTCTTLPSGDPEFQVAVKVLFSQLTGFVPLPMPREGSNVRAYASATMRGVP